MMNQFFIGALILSALSLTSPAHGQSTSKNKSGLTQSVANGKVVYNTYCVSCHQTDGGGMPNMNPPLIKTSYVLGDKTVLINVLLKGMSHQDIDGESYHNVMPPFDYLTDAEIADVLTFVRNSFGNKAKAVTAAEVQQTRAKNK